ncbi:MAG: TIGR02569 family protein [Mycobacteriaceae bacterium]|nr:TIGR02569 family protein [Mycobacteriaceae bacterium]
MAAGEQPPEHVLASFGLRDSPAPVGGDWDGSWRCGGVVLTPVADHARAAWSARVRESLHPEGIRLARPVRATDGRYVVSGWRSDAEVEGSPEPRYDEVVAAAQRLHKATAGLARPRFLSHGPIGPWMNVDVFVAADRAAWDDDPMRSLRRSQGDDFVHATTPDGEHSIELLDQLGSLRKPVETPAQLVHGDLFGTVLFAGQEHPGITDITPYWRPAPWAAGVAVVDAVSWGSADDGLLERWDDLPEWPQMLLRAVMFRLAVHALHPRSTAEALPGLLHTADLVRWMV